MLRSWRADYPNPPSFGRQEFRHNIQTIGETGYDDFYNMNTQSGSQVSIYNTCRSALLYNQLTAVDSGTVFAM